MLLAKYEVQPTEYDKASTNLTRAGFLLDIRTNSFSRVQTSAPGISITDTHIHLAHPTRNSPRRKWAGVRTPAGKQSESKLTGYPSRSVFII